MKKDGKRYMLIQIVKLRSMLLKPLNSWLYKETRIFLGSITFVQIQFLVALIRVNAVCICWSRHLRIGSIHIGGVGGVVAVAGGIAVVFILVSGFECQ
jgi:hypothetical protein